MSDWLSRFFSFSLRFEAEAKTKISERYKAGFMKILLIRKLFLIYILNRI